ncbi:MAG: FtsX-like permease family protein [Ardenticatenaceae bacterium]|nr:FtsX-like permease family protein [Ardenticatenaceae bacterium]MCB9004395.1 FtsX-like permease family protein [Ardenticatenaceae bacterium]
MLIKFAIRHLFRHWRVNMLVLAGLLLTAAFLAGLSPYATAIAGRNLEQRLRNASPAVRNMRVEGSSLNSALYTQFTEYFGDLIVDRVEVWEASGDGESVLYPEGDAARPFDEFLAYNAYAFSDLSQHIDLVEGRMPQHLTPVPNRFYQYEEVVIGLDAAENANLSHSVGGSREVMDLHVGDELRSPDGSLRFVIVGIAVPKDPQSDVWWGDLQPFTFLRQSLHGPSAPETVTLSFLVNQQAMDTYFNYNRYWRVFTDPAQVTVDTVDSVHAALSNAQAQLRVRVETGMQTLIEQYLTELSAAQTTLFLLTLQSLIFVFYTLAMISSFVLEQSQGEVASLAGRGFTRWQITAVFAIESFFLALLAAPMGPPLALAGLRLWGTLTNTVVPGSAPLQSWMLAWTAVLFGWITLVAAIRFGMRGSVLDWQREQARPPQRAAWQKYYFDFFLLALGGLVYWQLLQSGTFTVSVNVNATQEASGGTDPLLLIGPALLLIAGALVFLRLFPLLLRLVAWWSRRVRGLILPFGLARLSRDPLGPSRVVLLISLAAGLTLFASLFENSLLNRQAEMARHLTGTDLRVRLPIDAGEAEYEELAALPGVQAWSPVYYNSRSRWAPNLGRQAQMLAIDPDTFAQVSSFAPYVSTLSVPAIMPVLADDPGALIPAVFSYDAFPQDKEVGDQVTYIVGTHKVTFVVQGIIRSFPAISGPFFLTNLAAVERQVQLSTLSEPWVGQREVWLSISPAQHDALVARLLAGEGPTGAQIVGDARALEQEMQTDLVGQETLGAFNLNAAALVLLSVSVFLMVHFFAARERAYEFSVLRATGMSTRQLLSLLGLEGVLMMVLGLLAGTGIGYGLALAIRPFLSSSLRAAIAGNAIYEIIINWAQVSGLYALLIVSYAIILLILLAVLLQAGIQRTLRLGDE